MKRTTFVKAHVRYLIKTDGDTHAWSKVFKANVSIQINGRQYVWLERYELGFKLPKLLGTGTTIVTSEGSHPIIEAAEINTYDLERLFAKADDLSRSR
jgi:hypothetical protein